MNTSISHLFTCLLTLATVGVFAQTTVPAYAVASEVVESAATSAEKGIPSAENRAPMLIGTELDVKQWIADHLRYPELAEDYAIEGEVVISYLIGKDGEMTDVKVHKGLGFGCDEAALAVFENMPRWQPAIRNGEAVAVQCFTPIAFHLR